MTIHYALGTPCWADLASPDVSASTRFYNDVFGWTATEATEPEAGGYTLLRKDGNVVAAVGPRTEPEQPVAWTVYFASPDIEATASRIEAGGGQVLAGPMDVMGYGRMAVFADIAGATFAGWEAGEREGFEARGMPGAMVWAELLTQDVEASKTFYRTALGLESRDVPTNGGNYTILQSAENDVAGMMPMTEEAAREIAPYWLAYFGVEDPDAVAARVRELGGTVSLAPTDMAAGRYGVMADPHGAIFAIIKPNPDFRP